MSKHTIRLNDGTPVTIRPIRPADAILIHDMHRRLSLNSIYYRYLRPRRPTFEEIQQLCQLRHDKGAAFVAEIEIPQRLVIGLGHYVIEEKSGQLTAEPALLIEDKFQGQGLGRVLSQHLIKKALAQQIRTFNISIHPGNRRMMQIIQRSGLPFESKTTYGIGEVRLQLAPEPVQQPQRVGLLPLRSHLTLGDFEKQGRRV
jgi:RimJ/RimL family protein N-acetyltransferase